MIPSVQAIHLRKHQLKNYFEIIRVYFIATKL